MIAVYRASISAFAAASFASTWLPKKQTEASTLRKPSNGRVVEVWTKNWWRNVSDEEEGGSGNAEEMRDLTSLLMPKSYSDSTGKYRPKTIVKRGETELKRKSSKSHACRNKERGK